MRDERFHGRGVLLLVITDTHERVKERVDARSPRCVRRICSVERVKEVHVLRLVVLFGDSRSRLSLEPLFVALDVFFISVVGVVFNECHHVIAPAWVQQIEDDAGPVIGHGRVLREPSVFPFHRATEGLHNEEMV